VIPSGTGIHGVTTGVDGGAQSLLVESPQQLLAMGVARPGEAALLSVSLVE
jgi:hypothetical protein